MVRTRGRREKRVESLERNQQEMKSKLDNIARRLAAMNEQLQTRRRSGTSTTSFSSQSSSIAVSQSSSSRSVSHSRPQRSSQVWSQTAFPSQLTSQVESSHHAQISATKMNSIDSHPTQTIDLVESGSGSPLTTMKKDESKTYAPIIPKPEYDITQTTEFSPDNLEDSETLKPDSPYGQEGNPTDHNGPAWELNTITGADEEGLYRTSILTYDDQRYALVLVRNQEYFKSLLGKVQERELGVIRDNMHLHSSKRISRISEWLYKFDGFIIEDEIAVKSVQKGLGVRTTGIWKEKVGYTTDGYVDIFLGLDNEFNSAILQAALIIGEKVRRMPVQREGAGLDYRSFSGIEGLVFTHSNVKPKMIVKSGSLIFSSIRDSSISRLRWAEKFNLEYQLDKISEGLDSTTQVVVIDVYNKEHLMDLCLKPEIASGVKVEGKWLDGMHSLYGTVQRIVYTYIFPMMQSKQETDLQDTQLEGGSLLWNLLAMLKFVINVVFQPLVREYLKRWIDQTVEVCMSVLEKVKNGFFYDPFRDKIPQIRSALCERLLNYDEDLCMQVAVFLYDEACCALSSPESERTKFLEKMLEEKPRLQTRRQILGYYIIDNIKEHYATMSLHLCISVVKYMWKKIEITKLKVQKSVKYWQGRGARMKWKWKIMAVSYHPP